MLLSRCPSKTSFWNAIFEDLQVLFMQGFSCWSTHSLSSLLIAILLQLSLSQQQTCPAYVQIKALLQSRANTPLPLLQLSSSPSNPFTAFSPRYSWSLTWMFLEFYSYLWPTRQTVNLLHSLTMSFGSMVVQCSAQWNCASWLGFLRITVIHVIEQPQF